MYVFLWLLMVQISYLHILTVETLSFVHFDRVQSIHHLKMVKVPFFFDSHTEGDHARMACFFLRLGQNVEAIVPKTTVADLGKILVRAPGDFRAKNTPFWGFFSNLSIY